MSCYIPPCLPFPAPASLATQRIKIIPESQTDKRSWERKKYVYYIQLTTTFKGMHSVLLGRRGEKDSCPCYEHTECPH